jgi:hypothetical protein
MWLLENRLFELVLRGNKLVERWALGVVVG